MWFSRIFLALQYQVSHHSNKFREKFDKEKSRFGELYEGIKDSKLARTFQFIFILRRVLSATWIILSQGVIVDVRVGLFTLIQVLSLAYICITRPFERLQDNCIEIINDFIYFLVWTLLLYYNRASRWTDSSGSAVVAILTSNGIIIVLIQFLFMGKGKQFL